LDAGAPRHRAGRLDTGWSDHGCSPPIENAIAYSVTRIPSTLDRATAWVRLLTSSFE